MIKEKRLAAGLSRAEMARRFEIPIRTLENWEAGTRTPPVWAEKLIVEKLERMMEEGKMTDIEILMMDRCTESEAKKHLERGATIYTDLEENFDGYMSEWEIDEDDREDYERMISEKVPAPDWGVVEHDGKTYYIQYVL